MATLAELMVKIGVNTAEFSKGMNDVQSKLGNTGKNISSTMGKSTGVVQRSSAVITGALKGIGGAIVGAFAAREVFQFGQSVIEAGASAQAVNAQFDQVFGKLRGNAEKTVNSLGKEFGMVPERLKPAFSMMTSQFKGLGYDTKEAMSMAKDGITMVADSAAFYDMSFEDANAALNSFIKGNYEGGEAIGLFANETQMASWASKNLGMDWKELDEAGKQLVRLEYAQAMQKASGAMGQAARESENYENKVGNLRQSWENLKAKLAEPFMEPVIAGLTWLTDTLSAVDLSGFNAKVQSMFDKFSEGEGAITRFGGIFNTIKPVIEQALSAVSSFVQSKLSQIKSFWDQNGQQILQAVSNVWNAISPIIEVALNVALSVVKYVWNAIKGVISGALDIIMGLVKTFSGLFTGDFSKMWEGIKQLFSGAIQFVWNLMNLSFVGGLKTLVANLAKNLLKAIKGMWDDISVRFMYGKDKIVSLMNTAKSTLSKIWDTIKTTVVNTAKNLWASAQNTFNSMKSGISSIFNSIKSTAVSVWNSIKSGISGVVNGIKSVVTSVWNSIKSSISSILNGIKSTAISIWNSIKSAISTTVNGIKSTVSNIFNGIKSTVSSIFNGIKSTATSVWNGVKNAITSPIKTAKQTVLGIIDDIKGAFARMKIKIPKPKIPKISVSMKKGAMGIPYPDFNVNWNAKGAIFNGATILGGGQGVGEAGAEAVVPIQHKRYMRPFANAVATQLPTNDQNKEVLVENHVTTVIELDGEVVGRKVEKYVSRKQLDRQKRTNRRGGRY